MDQPNDPVAERARQRVGVTLKDNDLVIDAPDPFGEALQELRGDTEVTE